MRARWCLWSAVLIGCTSNPGGGGDDDGIDVFGHAWTFTVVSASISATKVDGSEWDPDGSPPDPFARVYLDGTLIGTTPELEDTFDPIWDFSTSPIVVNAGDTLSFDLIDSDVLVNDTIFTDCEVALTSSTAAGGGGTCTSSQGSLIFRVAVD